MRAREPSSRSRGNSYWIEVLGTPGGHGHPGRRAPTRKPWRRPVFDPATLKKLAKAIGSRSTAPTLSPRTMGRSDGWATRRAVRGEDGIYTAPGRDREINPDIPDLPEWQTLWPSTGLRSHACTCRPLWDCPRASTHFQNCRNYRDCRDCFLGFIWRGVCVRRPARRPQRPRILWQLRDGGSARRAVAAYRPLRSARSA